MNESVFLKFIQLDLFPQGNGTTWCVVGYLMEHTKKTEIRHTKLNISEEVELQKLRGVKIDTMGACTKRYRKHQDLHDRVLKQKSLISA